MEMAESGHSTQALPRDATDAQAQAALQWNDAAWPWKAYGPVVMAAVAAGVPVLGGNLPRAQMRAAMGEARWDQHLPAPALAQQHQALREHGAHRPAGPAPRADGAAGGRGRPCAAQPGSAHPLASRFGVKSGSGAIWAIANSYQKWSKQTRRRGSGD